ncbi:MAG: endonuclease MutS2 [Lachnospiraceae bacterium]|nr:endonuclease MutS2 [Lachnospiraceae bacterium]
MNERVLRVLEYNKIIGTLTGFAGSAAGKKLCEETKPLSKLEEIEQMQSETEDALARLYKKGTLSFSGISEIGEALKRLEVGATLSIVELLRISSLLTAVRRVKEYGASPEDAAEEEKDSVAPYFDALMPLEFLQREIDRCIIGEDMIADDASPKLKSIRRAIKTANEKIKDYLNSMMLNTDTRAMMQDALVTMRDGRYCIPVKAEHMSKFPGMVHDRSSSGSTVFIEPMAVVKLNNELKDLALDEQKEIERILEELSGQAASVQKELGVNRQMLAKLDYIFARATLAKQQKAVRPHFNDRRVIDIKKGRHPLIDPKKIVPTDIRVGEDFNLLVITGPNTGGKTVALKTIGLFTLMGQAGLHIPAGEGSRLGVFKEVYADIGDEQSIEQSLSTFSSHMTNTVSILENADYESLVLFDELGAGTDPTEGAALAMAILKYLHARDVRTVATTHYSELKIFALQTKGVSNACCEFDVESLRPTYRLLIGIPGKSNAFAISQKLGLGKDIIDSAKDLIGEQEKSFEDVISGLENDRIRMEREKKEIAELKARSEELEKRLTEKQEKFEASREKILAEAREKAADIVAEAKEYVDKAIRDVNRAGGSVRDMEAQRSALREKLDGYGPVKPVRKPAVKKQDNRELKEGDVVTVLTMGLEGTLLSTPNAKGEVAVQVGAMRMTVKAGDVEFLREKQETKPEKRASSNIGYSKAMSVSTEVNVIGLRVDEALPVVEKYLDDAYLAHLEKVNIIHGRGTGALRDAIHSKLKRTPYVKSYRLGEFGEGDRGVTIVEFKK